MKGSRGFAAVIRVALVVSALEACGARTPLGLAGSDPGASSDSRVPAGSPDPFEPPADAGAKAPADASPVDCSAPSIVGTWHGTIDGFVSASGSDTVTMTFMQSGGSVAGTVYFGDATPPPAPTDPGVGYPPGFYDSSSQTGTSQFFVDGFRHPAWDIAFAGTRLALRIWTVDVWSAWCGLQDRTYRLFDVDSGPPTYGCLPDWNSNGDGRGTCTMTDPTTKTAVPVDCGKLALCTQAPFQRSVCRCTADSCAMSTNPDGVPDIAFELRITCNRLEGSVSGSIGSMGVHLVREP